MRIVLTMPVVGKEKYPAGTRLDLPEKDAARLIRLGAAVPDKTDGNGSEGLLTPPAAGSRGPDGSENPTGEAGEGPPEAAGVKSVYKMSREELIAELAAAGVPLLAGESLTKLRAKLREVRAEQ